MPPMPQEPVAKISFLSKATEEVKLS